MNKLSGVVIVNRGPYVEPPRTNLINLGVISLECKFDNVDYGKDAEEITKEIVGKECVINVPYKAYCQEIQYTPDKERLSGILWFILLEPLRGVETEVKFNTEPWRPRSWMPKRAWLYEWSEDCWKLSLHQPVKTSDGYYTSYPHLVLPMRVVEEVFGSDDESFIPPTAETYQGEGDYRCIDLSQFHKV